jgi:hypothetical protein
MSNHPSSTETAIHLEVPTIDSYIYITSSKSVLFLEAGEEELVLVLALLRPPLVSSALQHAFLLHYCMG